MDLCLTIHVADESAALHANGLVVEVDVDAVHGAQVDEHALVDARQTGNGVTAAAHGDDEPVVACEIDRVDHIGGTCRLDDDGRTTWVHRVVRGTHARVTGIVRGEDATANRHAELFESLVADLCCGSRQRRNACGHRAPFELGCLCLA